jgi:hypothetical protein
MFVRQGPRLLGDHLALDDLHADGKVLELGAGLVEQWRLLQRWAGIVGCSVSVVLRPLP